jgi:hypothetical protein
MQRTSDGASPIICQAIQQRRKLAFYYKGLRRIVAPYCYGFSTADAEILRAIQLGGQSTSRKYGMGKLWTVSLMSQLELIDETFGPDDPNYNPNDSAMKRIICRID